MTYNSVSNTFNVYHSSVFDSMNCPIIEPIVLGDLDNMSLSGAAEAWNSRTVLGTERG